ncbi:MAG: hypothetical protein LUH11_01650 [Candidatus Gastranaerophilales bacterium]|nr:hypothetical protein [Candidatus Gastranaerophilales bacterium]
MKINIVKIQNTDIKNTYTPNFNRRKNYKSNNKDTVTFSNKTSGSKSDLLRQKVLNLFGMKQNKSAAVSEADIKRAQDGFKAYQYQSAFINTVLRNTSSPEEAIKQLSRISKDFFDGKETEAYFVEKGFDLLSEPLEEDTIVYRYIYSSDNYNASWKIGDKIQDKGFISTTSDGSENSYPKSYVKKNLENYNGYNDTNGCFYTMIITIPKGTKVIKGNEVMSEILLKYGSTFQVTDFNPETNTYECKIV